MPLAARRGLPLAALCLAAALPACVSRGTHDLVVAERDRLAQERELLSRRVELLETSNESLSSERVQLLDQTEDLRQRRETLEREVAQLERTRGQLESAQVSLAEREAELAALRATYDELVVDLQSEVERGRMRIRALENGVQILDFEGEALFPPGSVEPSAEGILTLRTVAQRLRKLDERVEVHGHTDDVPITGALGRRFPTNWELAAARAARVVRILVEQGVPPERVIVVSHGEHDPVAPNDTVEGRARNRRIEVRLLPPPSAGAAAATP